jgi:ribosomal protein S18 acetylase RimI-like enzyme
MIIRRLTGEDASQYKEIRLQGLKNHPEAFSSSYEEESTYSLEVYSNRLSGTQAVALGAFVEQKLVGVVTLFYEQKKKLIHRASIVAMYVDQDYRNVGIGKALMVQAIKQARESESIKQLYLSVTSSNLPAKGLYQSLGFKTYGVDEQAMKVDDTYYDEDLMVLKL